MSELKPCPFCGETGHISIFHQVYGSGCWYVKCGNCKASTGNFPSKDTAMSAWNIRDNLIKRIMRRWGK